MLERRVKWQAAYIVNLNPIMRSACGKTNLKLMHTEEKCVGVGERRAEAGSRVSRPEGSMLNPSPYVLLMSSVNMARQTTSQIAAKFGNLIKIPQIRR